MIPPPAIGLGKAGRVLGGGDCGLRGLTELDQCMRGRPCGPRALQCQALHYIVSYHIIIGCASGQ